MLLQLGMQQQAGLLRPDVAEHGREVVGVRTVSGLSGELVLLR